MAAPPAQAKVAQFGLIWRDCWEQAAPFSTNCIKKQQQLGNCPLAMFGALVHSVHQFLRCCPLCSPGPSSEIEAGRCGSCLRCTLSLTDSLAIKRCNPPPGLPLTGRVPARNPSAWAGGSVWFCQPTPQRVSDQSTRPKQPRTGESLATNSSCPLHQHHQSKMAPLTSTYQCPLAQAATAHPFQNMPLAQSFRVITSLAKEELLWPSAFFPEGQPLS